ncbi:hypothetical protein [Magnetospirillum moscoviense]|uniref:hypothetical protein n=1 Tax=Magnetospirillum moscoviense TaxID=1437059 RepID=UPI0012E878D8|nr:hypothetical protein [Magnetospirillum moscoviense]MBF0325458.1 hypothetical protein [Alphaproteobacteria bacterium]
MKALMAMAGLLLLAACTGAYDPSLDKFPTARYEAPTTKADQVARGPYDTSPYFTGARN